MRPVRNIRATYRTNKDAKVGETCYCPSCGQPFRKEHYQQAFCKTKPKTQCKDKYWNTVTPHKRNNVTRISPANARYYAEHIEPFKIDEDFDDDQSWDAHKDSF